MTDLKSNNEKILKGPDFTYNPHPYGVGYAFYESMSNNKQLIAQIDAVSGQRDNYGSLLERSIRVAIKLQAMGVTSNDIVCSCSYNHLNSCVPFIAASFIGAIYAGLEPSLHLTDTSYLLKQVCPKIIFVANEAIELIENVIKEAEFNTKIICFEKSEKYPSFDEFLEVSPDENGFRPIEKSNLQETVAIFFSSGTTGLPKGICINHYNLLGQSYNISYLKCNYERVLLCSSLYCTSAAFFLTHSILFGTCRIVYRKFDPNTIWEIVEKYKPTVIFTSPYIAITMTKIKRPRGMDLKKLSAAIVGGGLYTMQQAVEFQNRLNGAPVYSVYGLSEVVGMACYHLLSDRSKWTGNLMPGFGFKIVDLETEQLLESGQKGELRMKSKFVMNGYYKKDSSDSWDVDGWLKTGDIAYYDDNHTIYIVERIKEMLKFRSWPFSPAVLEEILLNHPAVKKAVVVGLPHAVDGDHPLGLVELQDKTVTAEELIKYVDERVDSRQKLRGGIRFIDEIPVTPSGKLKRKELRQLAIEGRI